jgi:hypothetical protein
MYSSTSDVGVCQPAGCLLTSSAPVLFYAAYPARGRKSLIPLNYLELCEWIKLLSSLMAMFWALYAPGAISKIPQCFLEATSLLCEPSVSKAEYKVV